MELRFWTSVLVLVPLAWAFYYLLKKREFFRPLYPFGFAALFLAIARILDIPVETPSLHVADWFGYSPDSFNASLNLVGDIADTVGIVFLAWGFVRGIESVLAGQQRIETLEALLPVCAWCKRVRTEEGIWEPVEKYLQDRGAPEATHGICPDCAARVLREKRGDWTTEGDITEGGDRADTQGQERGDNGGLRNAPPMGHSEDSK
jgi:hypothetical protein